MRIHRSTHFTLGGRTDDPFKAELEAFRLYEAAAQRGNRVEAKRLFEVWREVLMQGNLADASRVLKEAHQ